MQVPKKVLINKSHIQLFLLLLLFLTLAYFFYYDALVVAAHGYHIVNHGIDSSHSDVHHELIPKSTRFHFENISTPHTSKEYERLKPQLDSALGNATELVSRFNTKHIGV